MVDAGTPQGPTNGCSYSSETGNRYYHRGFDTSAYLNWENLYGGQDSTTTAHICGDQGCVTGSWFTGTWPCVWPCFTFATGYTKAIDDALDHCRVYASYDPVTGTTWHRKPLACGKSVMQQTRQVTTFPDGSKAYGAWSDTGQVGWLSLPIEYW